MDTDLSSPHDYRRRDLLKASLGMLAGLAAPSLILAQAAPVAQQSAQSASFLRLSAFLTGKSDLDPVIAARTLQALSANDANFAARLAQLDEALTAARSMGLLNDMSHFDISSLGSDTALKATAVEIVSAWYLGYVGSGARAKLITYHEALMYRPTAGITTIPSYQLGGYGYWIPAPQLKFGSTSPNIKPATA